MENKVSSSETKYAHLWLDNGKTVGRATIAFKSVGPNKVRGTIVFCSPKDRYYRSIGRTISSAKLEYGQSLEVEFTEGQAWRPAVRLREIFQDVLDGVCTEASSFRYPKWATNAAVYFNGEVPMEAVSAFKPTKDPQPVIDVKL